MQRLSGPTLGDHYPYTPEDIRSALDLDYKLLIEAGIAYYDTKGANFMWNKEPDGTERLYLIDYGSAGLVTKIADKDRARYMRNSATLLLNSLTTKSVDYGTPGYWITDTAKARSELFIVLYKAADVWLKQHFPGRKLYISVSMRPNQIELFSPLY